MLSHRSRRHALRLILAPVLFGALAAAPGLGAGAQARPLHLVAFGDSLTAGYMLPADAAFPAVLEKRLNAAGLAVTIVNAGVSGDTTAAGLARLDWSIPDGTDGVILELGANDALRGLDPARAQANLDAMLARLAARNIPVLLAGMLAPRNNGPEYATAFDGMFRRLAEKHGATLYPFFLEGQAGVAGLTLPDGIHPNRQGVEKIVDGIYPTAEKFVRLLAEKKGAN
ncbi:MAG: arylesterase [Rhizobiaceae bacterium]